MRDTQRIAVIIPAFNEESAIGKVISAIPAWVDDIIVVDNGSTDRTAEVARDSGARVVAEPRRGYGSACLAGIAALSSPAIVVFLDGDYSDYPEEMALLVDPIAHDEADVVIGSRTIGQRERGALTPQALFGNWLACTLIRLLWAVSFTDLGPFRAIRYSTLTRLSMRDRNYGWTVEMQIKAARDGARIREAPVRYRKRIGKSKVSGTVRGVAGAGFKILFTIARAAFGFLPGQDNEKISERAIVFTRYPKPGHVKTRLIPVLGADGAAALQQLMSEHIIRRIEHLESRRSLSWEVRYEGGTGRMMSRWLGRGRFYRRQDKGDLGRRMAKAFEAAFDEGMARVVIIGSDCPDMSAELLEQAFHALGGNDLVLGPAEDGGYYLIGLRRLIPRLFVGIPWGTGKVLNETLQVADELQLSTALLERLADVDRPEDIAVWNRHIAQRKIQMGSSATSISVIIPALDEEESVSRAAQSARSASSSEVIVVDGGSTDGTARAARSAGAVVLASAPGRAVQMNTGARASSGDILVFLHADTCLPQHYDRYVCEALARPGVVAGAFELGLDAPGRGIRFIEGGANLRSRHFQTPYGDQALFLRKERFHDMGGFPEIPILEDFEFVRRLRHHGRIEVAPAPIITSARRWMRLGIWRTTMINQVVTIAYFLGVPLSRLARWYYGTC